MEENCILDNFGVKRVFDRVCHSEWASVNKLQDLSAKDALQIWLLLVPEQIKEKIELARNQEMPFMPPDFTPEILSTTAIEADGLPSLNVIEVICVCMDLAVKAANYDLLAALIYTVDRALYRFGRSKPLLRVVSDLRRASPDTAVAPQVTLRSARVMKDEGDLNGSLKVIHSIISREDGWQYKDNGQYLDTKAACLHVQGQIFHNLELWHYAIPPLVEGLELFQHVQDLKGMGSCLHVLSRCLCHLQQHEYDLLRRQHPKVFETDHPCYEGYRHGQGATQNVQHIQDRFFVAKHLLAADESLLMFAVQSPCPIQFQQLLQQITVDIKHSLAGHRAVDNLQNVESFVEFARAVFLASLVLSQSFCDVDRQQGLLLEGLSQDLYEVMCCKEARRGQSTSLKLDANSVSLMNDVLCFLGLPQLQGSFEYVHAKLGGDFDSGSSVQATDSPVPDDINEPASTGNAQESDGLMIADSTRNVVASTDDESARQESTTPQEHIRQTDTPTQPSRLPDTSGNNTNVGSDTSGRTCQSQSSGYADLPLKASTFPQTSHRTPAAGPRRGVHPQKRYVGLAMNREELRVATWPAMSAEAEQRIVDINSLGRTSDDLDSLSLSTNTNSSSCSLHSASADASSNKRASECQYATQEAVIAKPLSLMDDNSQCRSTDSNNQHGSLSVDPNNQHGSLSVDSNNQQRSLSIDSRNQNESLSTNAQTQIISSSRSILEETQNLTEGSSHHVCARCGSSRTGPSTVDRNATTKSSSPATPHSSVSEAISCNEQFKELSKSRPESLVSSLQLGSNSKEHIDDSKVDTVMLQQLSQDKTVCRATLLTYNAWTGQWSRQTTLAHVGDELLLADKNPKGAFRDAFFVSFLHQGEPLARYVGKKYRNGQRPCAVYMHDVMQQMMASYYVTLFNKALNSYQTEFLRIQFLPAFHLQLQNAEGEVVDWLNVEPYMEGHYHKLTNNAAHVNGRQELVKGLAVATAFSHFSYVASDGHYMVVDLQGCVPDDKDGVIYLTDPVLHTRSKTEVSAFDRHEKGMADFWDHVHKQCNGFCRFLGIDQRRA
ncbi:alpha-protein kinase 1-like [Littorina saxatilis]|uniref:Alpha-type protein kinase domain-containing protein n=1 Tax=Littorina saxatilis TaxID=31220 RepID=A0AAN9C053_9CAEN